MPTITKMKIRITEKQLNIMRGRSKLPFVLYKHLHAYEDNRDGVF